MSLPPLVNFFASYQPDLAERRSLLATMRSSGDFQRVFEVAGSWAVGICPLPGDDVDQDLETAGLLVAEGAGRLVATRSPVSRQRRMSEIRRMTAEFPDRLHELAGDFTFVDVRSDGSATLVRSCAGLAPLFYTRSRDRPLIGTRIRYVARYGDRAELDPLVTALWVSGWLLAPDQRTVLRDCSIVPIGHAVTLRRGSPPSITRYWDPWIDEQPRRLSEVEAVHVSERFAASVVETLSDQLVDDSPNLLSLSGGVDSAILAAVAATELGRPVATVTFVPREQKSRARELSYVAGLARSVPLHSMALFDLRPDDERMIDHPGVRTITPVVNPAFRMLERLSTELGSPVVFGGQFADDVAGGNVTLPDWLAVTSFWQALRLTQNPHGIADLMRWFLWRKRWRTSDPYLHYSEGILAAFRPSIQAEWIDRRQRLQESVPNHTVPRHALRLALEQHGWVTMYWEAASECGNRVVLPFLSRDLIELSARLHPRDLIGPGLKKPLRLAFSGRLPSRNLHRGKPSIPPTRRATRWIRRSRPGPAPTPSGVSAHQRDERIEQFLELPSASRVPLAPHVPVLAEILEASLRGLDAARRMPRTRQLS